ncbi:tetratricopeptide repeat protein [Streptomyces deccanensis]|uniref:tetratricopeptide repeat protein n=1 Tax=Streptomyces deccanensis TaxID=424188 RepID=UPI001EFBD516|nr:tetratricopeptide repeat protein [Streptomyces deccanensis]ULR52426.1 tetratricopeptide repeat protein [Streptomyces deccanensis]
MRGASAGDEASGGPSVEASGERAVAAGRDIRQVATGDFATQVQVEQGTVLPAEALTVGDVTWPVRYLPGRTGHFVGRERELALLDEAFEAPGGVVVHAVHGLGGVGKSTLAARWAAGRGADVNPVWWIGAESRAQLDAGLADLGRALTPALAGTLPEAALRERTLQWLSAHDGWLLVLDNVDDPADIEPLLARAANGRFLVTTRRGSASWRGIAHTLDLDVLARDEAVELFTTIYDGPTDGVEELCAELGRLPLAIDQAAAYCREACVSPREYLGLVTRCPADMYAVGAEGGDAERTVARVWQITLDRLADTRAAKGILRTIAWCGQDIPRAYLNGLADPVELTEGLRRLAAYSMIRLHGDLISVHRLVQAVSRSAEPEHAMGIRNFVVRLLQRVRPKDTIWGEAAQVWVTHVEAMASYASPGSETEELAMLFMHAGAHLARTDPLRATALGERGATILERHGTDDFEAARTVRHTKILAHLMSGEHGQAVPMLEQDLGNAVDQFGASDVRALRLRDALVLALSEVDSAKAEALARENVELGASALASDDPMLFRLRLRLTMLTCTAPDPSAVEALLAEAAEVLDEDDPDVSFLERWRLRTLLAAGEGAGALELAERLVVSHRKVLGGLDPVTLDLRVVHVNLVSHVGEKTRAMKLFSELMEECLEAAEGDRQDGRPLQYAMERFGMIKK